MDRYFPAAARRLTPAHGLSLLILLVPPVVLALFGLELRSPLLFGGSVAGALAACLVVRAREVWRPPTGGLVILLYAMALGWLWLATGGETSSGLRLARGGFVLVAVALFAVQDLTRSGVEPRRRAKALTGRLLVRLRWPGTVAGYADLPDVRRLHAAVRTDPSLAFVLVEDRRPDVQLAGLMALQGRPYWRWDEAAVVLKAAKLSTSPEVRSLALAALHKASGAEFLRGLAPFLKDGSPDVRLAATEAILADGGGRWGMVREAVRAALSDPALAADGPLPGGAGRLPAVAICDFTGWAVEPAPLAERAVRTLLAHYDASLADPHQPTLAADLGRQVTDEATPAVLRVELAHLLRRRGSIPAEQLDRMTDADQPGPIRLLAAEIILADDPNDQSGLDVLRGLGRQSNRDTALAIARILETCAGMTFGLPPAGIAPTPKQSADVTQKVLRWATGRNSDEIDLTPLPFGRADGVYGPSSNPGVRTPDRWKARR